MDRLNRNAPAQFVLLLSLLSPGLSAPARGAATVNFHGTLQAVSCQINNNQPVAVEFGTVQADNLAAATASLALTVDCTGAVSSNGVSVAVTGDETGFSSQALKTSTDGLGVTLTPPTGSAIGQSPLNIGTYYNMTMLGLSSATGTVNLTAGLVSDGTTSLTGGEFTATATLVLKMV